MKKVYVVTGTDLGWDCVIGVFDSDKVTLEELKEKFSSENTVVSTRELESDTSDWD